MGVLVVTLGQSKPIDSSLVPNNKQFASSVNYSAGASVDIRLGTCNPGALLNKGEWQEVCKGRSVAKMHYAIRELCFQGDEYGHVPSYTL